MHLYSFSNDAMHLVRTSMKEQQFFHCQALALDLEPMVRSYLVVNYISLLPFISPHFQ